MSRHFHALLVAALFTCGCATLVARINAGGPPLPGGIAADPSDARTYAAVADAIRGTVYATHAWRLAAPLVYRIAVPSAVYDVRLQFCENWPPAALYGTRVLDVFVNQRRCAHRLDVAYVAGGLYKKYDVVARNLTVADGFIVVRIVPVVQNAFLSGIVVIRTAPKAANSSSLPPPPSPAAAPTLSPPSPAATPTPSPPIPDSITSSVYAAGVNLAASFTRVDDYPLHVFEAQGTLLLNGSEAMLAVFGGFYGFPNITARSYARRFGVLSAPWVPLADMPTPTVTHMAQWASGDTFCGAGGFVGPDPGRSGKQVWCYNMTADSWRQLPDLPADRAGGGLVLVRHAGKRTLLFAGGVDRENDDHSVYVDYGTTWELDWDAPTAWVDTGATMPDPRNHMAAVETCGRYLFVGGQQRLNEHTGNRRTVSEWLPAERRWSDTPPAPLPHAVGHISASVMPYRCGMLVVGGIKNGRKHSNAALWWNPHADVWSSIGAYPNKAATPVCGVRGDTLMCATGGERYRMQDSVFVALIDQV